MEFDVVELTRRLIAFDTLNPPGDEADAANFVAELLEAAGFEVRTYSFAPNRVSVVARRGNGSGPRICLSGHLDTVPLGATDWSFDPLGGVIEAGRLYGRGASDMKSGVAAMIVAAATAGRRLDDGPGALLVFTAGEETGCEGATHLAGVAGAVEEVGALVIGEPTSNLVKIGHKGALWLRAASRGRTAHGSMPELGVNAIFRSVEILNKLQDFGFNIKPHASLGSPSLNVGQITAGMNINSVPDLAQIGIDIRTIPGMSHGELLKTLRAYLAPELDQLSPLVDLESVWTSAEDPWLRRVRALLPAQWPTEGARGLPFFTDASVLKPTMGEPPTLIIGPGETEQAHQTDEHCILSRIPEAVGLYRTLLEDWQDRSIA